MMKNGVELLEQKKDLKEKRKKDIIKIIKEKIMDIKPTPKSIIGMLLIIFAIIDFLVGWIGGGDIFSFLPWYISMFTPIIIGGIGFGMLEHRKQKKK
tara:strand:+ start:428 stop:718 length:291 start_codon:yes stop_codon:yes gene_type:complete